MNQNTSTPIIQNSEVLLGCFDSWYRLAQIERKWGELIDLLMELISVTFQLFLNSLQTA